MKNFNRWLVIAGLLCLAAGGRAFAESAGTVTYIEGRVDRLGDADKGYLPVVLGETVSLGNALRTKTYSKAEITLLDGSVVRLGDNTQVRISEYALDPSGKRQTGAIQLERGKIRAIVAKAGDDAPFRIMTPNASGAVKGSDLFVAFEKSATTVLVDEGIFRTFHLNFPDQAVEVGKGKASEIPVNAPPREPRKFLPVEKEAYVSQTGPSVRQTQAELKDREVTRAVIVKLHGAVRVQPHMSGEWHVPVLNEVLNPGDKIETGENGRIEISLDNGHVLELRPETQLILNMLSRDPKTGQYQNLFDSEFGRIRAKLQKVTKGSSFEIKTPTSVCGVRGTIMYLVISKVVTKAFFEGGDGYMLNRLSKVSKTIYAGMTASSDDQGKVTDPVDTTGEERQEFDSEWGDDKGDDDEYGYSKPDGGDAGDDMDTPDQGGQGSSPSEMTDGVEGGDGQEAPFDEIPPYEDTDDDSPDSGGDSEEGGEDLPPVSSEIAMSGKFGDANSILDGGGGVGEIAATMETPEGENIWNPGGAQMNVAGTFENAGGNLWGGNVDGGTDDGGGVAGVVAGTWHSWEGVLAALYIDPAGMAGVMQGYMSGDTEAEGDTFSGGGTVYTTPMEQTGIPPADLVDAIINHGTGNGTLRGFFSEGEGRIEAQTGSERMSIGDADWGIWRAFFQGAYENPDGQAQWQAVTGGGGDGQGFGIGVLTGTDDLNGILRIQYELVHMLPGEWVIYNGNILGLYEDTDGESYAFEGAGAGSWVSTPLDFSGLWGGGDGSDGALYADQNGNIAPVDTSYGLIGGMKSPWSGPAEYLALGERAENSQAEVYLWNTTFESPRGGATTGDGGAFWGYSAGILDRGDMEGKTLSFYIDPDGQAGYLRGDVSGEFRDDLGMWMASGTLVPEPMASGLPFSPSELESIVEPEPKMVFNLSGSFEGQGSITGGGEGYPRFMDDGTTRIPWGIINLTYGSGNTYLDKPEESSQWSAVFGGSDVAPDVNYFIGNITEGSWEDGRLSAKVAGTHLTDETLLTFDGDFMGIETNIPDLSGDGLRGGTWIGTSLGTISAQHLVFTGIWGDQRSTLYVNGGGSAVAAGHDLGMMGGTVSPWSVPADFLAIGEFQPEDGPVFAGAYAWNSRVMSYNGPAENYTTLDGGAFSGVSAGLIEGDSASGGIYAFYLDPEGNAGYLTGSVTGEFYEDIGMWVNRGTLTAIPKTRLPGVLPEDFGSVIEQNMFNDTRLMGSVGEEGVIRSGWGEERNYGIAGADGLSVVDLRFGDGQNTYYNPSGSAAWSARMFSSDDTFYAIYEIDGTMEDGLLKGDVSGLQMSPVRLSHMAGDFYGLYTEVEEDGGDWIGNALMIEEDYEPFTFTGRWGEEPGTVYYSDGGSLAVAGFDLGLIGAAVSPWAGPQDFIAMGEFNIFEGEWPYMWCTRIESFNGPAFESDPTLVRTTLDGGAFYGITAGLVDTNAFDGKLYAFYLDPNRNYGILKGEMAGSYFGDAGVWKLEGAIEPEFLRQMPGTAPKDFNSLVVRDSFEGEGDTFFADFGDAGGYIASGSDNGHNYTLGQDGVGVLESLYDLRLGSENTFSNPGESTTWRGWIAEVDDDFAQILKIDGTWEDGLVRGTLYGKAIEFYNDRLSTVYGDLYGVYTDGIEGDGTWSAVGIGYSTAERLAVTGMIDGSGGSIFRNVEGMLQECGTSSGLFATTVSPWLGAPAPVTSIGRFETEGDDSLYVWMAPFYSYDYLRETYTTRDGGAFAGWTVANWKNSNIAGFISGLYLSPAGDVGVFSRTIEGDYVNAMDFWSFEGIFGGTGSRKIVNSGIAPEEFHESLEFTDIALTGRHGTFEGGQGNITSSWIVAAANVDGRDWGVWATAVAGTFSGPTSPQWKLPFNGFQISPRLDDPYIMGVATGTAWADGTLSGTVAGVALDGVYYEDGHVYTGISTVTGQVEGAYELEGEQWQAVGTGEWVEVTELVDLADLADLTEELSTVAQGIGLQITEMASIQELTGAGQFAAGGNLSAAMDLNLYGLSETATEGIWAGLIRDGAYSGPVSSNWTLEFTNGSDIVQLLGTQWDSATHLWSADVAGNVAGNDLIGKANGAFREAEEGAGVFSGIAEGTWQAAEPQQAV